MIQAEHAGLRVVGGGDIQPLPAPAANGILTAKLRLPRGARLSNVFRDLALVASEDDGEVILTVRRILR